MSVFNYANWDDSLNGNTHHMNEDGKTMRPKPISEIIMTVNQPHMLLQCQSAFSIFQY